MMDAFGDMAGDAAGMMGNAMGMTLQPMLEATIEPTLMFLAPKVGEMAAQKMIDKYSQLAEVPNLVQEACNAATNAMMEYLQELIEYCQDVLDDVSEGFHHVLCDLMRAIRAGVAAAVEAIMNLMPGCLGMCMCVAGMFFDNTDVIMEITDAMLEVLKDYLKGELQKRNIPPQLADMLPWNASPDDEIPPPRSGNQVQQEPQQQGMGEMADELM